MLKWSHSLHSDFNAKITAKTTHVTITATNHGVIGWGDFRSPLLQKVSQPRNSLLRGCYCVTSTAIPITQVVRAEKKKTAGNVEQKLKIIYRT